MLFIVMIKPQRKRPLGRPMCRLEDNIKMYLEELEWRDPTGLIWLTIGTGGGAF